MFSQGGKSLQPICSRAFFSLRAPFSQRTRGGVLCVLYLFQRLAGHQGASAIQLLQQLKILAHADLFLPGKSTQLSTAAYTRAWKDPVLIEGGGDQENGGNQAAKGTGRCRMAEITAG